MAATGQGSVADAFSMLLSSRSGGKHEGGAFGSRGPEKRKMRDTPRAGSAFCSCVVCGSSVPRAVYDMHINECLDSSECKRSRHSVASCSDRSGIETLTTGPWGDSASGGDPPNSAPGSPGEAKRAPPGAGGGAPPGAGRDADVDASEPTMWRGATWMMPASEGGGEGAGGDRPSAPINLSRPEPLKQARIRFGAGLGLVTHGHLPEPPSVTVLQTGMVLLRNQVDLATQQQLVEELQSKADRFHRPHTLGGRKYHLYRMCYGAANADPAARRYGGEGEQLAIPEWLRRLGVSLGQLAQSHSPVHPPELRFDPDIAMVNYYPVRSQQLGEVKLGGHVDNDPDSIMPVVSVSIGDSMTFFYRRLPPQSRRPSLLSRGVPLPAPFADPSLDNDPADNKEHALVLKSGDVLVFGGESRMVYHGTRDVLPGTKPLPLRMAPGRLNITFRQHNIPKQFHALV